MSTYKVTYLNFRGLAEPIRILFSYAGVSFTDKRLNSMDWKKIKPTTPFGHVPVLEIDGIKVTQSLAICRYLAKKFCLAGKNDWEALMIDSTVDTLKEIHAKSADVYYEKEPAAKAEKRKLAQKMTKIYLAKLDEQVKQNGGYLVGGKLSWADIVFIAYLDMYKYSCEADVTEHTENLKALKDKVMAVPGIKAWIDKRPQDDF